MLVINNNNKLIVTDPVLNAGVYKIKYDNCEFVYISVRPRVILK